MTQTKLLTVDSIFEALSVCASLHPDPNLSPDEEMDDASVFLYPDEPGAGPFEVFTGDEGQELSEVGRVRSNFITDARFKPY
jgi:nucleotide-sensitive chloride channel 1A